MPEEASQQFVVETHRLTRKLDDDPFTDTLWGILTGYSASDGLRIASTSNPLVIHKTLSATSSVPIEYMDEAISYSEAKKNHARVKSKDGPITVVTSPDDPTSELVEALNSNEYDMFITSGHSCEYRWKIGYNYNAGEFISKNGVLYGVDTNKKIYPIHSTNPKVYLAPGNCLIGHIKDRQSMALAYMGSCGVNQMIGYIIPTGVGYGGWGSYRYFVNHPGKFNMVESWYLNTQHLIAKLTLKYPGRSDYDIKGYATTTIDKIGKTLGYKKMDAEAIENVNLLMERDVVVLYGDPAWDARLAERNLPWDQSLTESDGVYTFEVKGNLNVPSTNPPAAFLPQRIKGEVLILEGREYEPVIADNFLMLTKFDKVEKDKTYRLVFRATKAISGS